MFRTTRARAIPDAPAPETPENGRAAQAEAMADAL